MLSEKEEASKHTKCPYCRVEWMCIRTLDVRSKYYTITNCYHYVSINWKFRLIYSPSDRLRCRGWFPPVVKLYVFLTFWSVAINFYFLYHHRPQLRKLVTNIRCQNVCMHLVKPWSSAPSCGIFMNRWQTHLRRLSFKEVYLTQYHTTHLNESASYQTN